MQAFQPRSCGRPYTMAVVDSAPALGPGHRTMTGGLWRSPRSPPHGGARRGPAAGAGAGSCAGDPVLPAPELFSCARADQVSPAVAVRWRLTGRAPCLSAGEDRFPGHSLMAILCVCPRPPNTRTSHCGYTCLSVCQSCLSEFSLCCESSSETR